jgi:putative cell wall-binding protein
MSRILMWGALLLAVTALPPAAGAQEEPACPAADEVLVPGAELVQVTCLDDLTTLSNPRVDPTTFGWGGSGTRSSATLQSAATEFSDETVAGVQIEGWFEGDSCSRYDLEHTTFMPTCPGGFRHNGQFVLRIPHDWDGIHLVVAGAPGVRTQFAHDIILSDFAMLRRWAFIGHDKGNTGLNFFRAGDDETAGEATTWVPPAAIAQWGGFMGRAAVAGQGALADLHGRGPEVTYAAGISNGGYQTRLALERHPDLFDGGVDWEGTLFTPDPPNLYTSIPPLLQGYPAYRASGDAQGYATMVHEGRVPPDSEPVWDNHYAIYWGAVASTYRPVVDPEYTDYVAAPRLVVPPGDPDAEYDYASRPDVVRERVAELANTGDTSGLPLITLHGTLDALLPIDVHSDRYAQMVRDRGHDETYRYYVVEGGTHVDNAADASPEVFRPILPCFWASLEALDGWVRDGVEPAPSGFIPFPADTTAAERANTCGLPDAVGRLAGADRLGTAQLASRSTFGITETVVIATAADFPDALTAAPLAAALAGPILLVDGAGDGAVDDGLRRELARMGVREAVIVGGTAAVSEGVEAALAAEGLATRRVAGVDRYATAAAVAAELGAATGTTGADEVVLASGRSFADALSVAPVAAAAGTPILLTEPDRLPPVTAAAVADLGASRTLVVGGAAAVADAMLAEVPDPVRVAGPDRYATSAAVAALGLERGHRLDEVYLATGRDFPDALAAGPVAAAGEWGAPDGGLVLLVDGRDPAGSAATTALLAERSDEIERALLFGGTAAISSEVEAAIRTALR